jgi:signal transduction histidine kinase
MSSRPLSQLPASKRRPLLSDGYRSSFWIGLVILVVVAARAILFFSGQAVFPQAAILLAAFSLLYLCEPFLSARLPWFRYAYFPVQTALLFSLANLRPFLDITNLLYVHLSLQAIRLFSARASRGWILLFSILLAATLVLGLGWLEGISLALSIMASGALLLSFTLTYNRLASAQAQSQVLLEQLRQAHEQLKQQADQVEELAAVQERNRLARELHDSVSQVVFSVNLTSQATRILLAKDPARVPEQLDRLQEMTGGALSQLRLLIAQLRPAPKA